MFIESTPESVLIIFLVLGATLALIAANVGMSIGVLLLSKKESVPIGIIFGTICPTVFGGLLLGTLGCLSGVIWGGLVSLMFLLPRIKNSDY